MWRVTWARLRSDRPSMVALGVLAVIAAAALLAPALAAYDPNATIDFVAMRNQAPTVAHPFGTDVFSRDVLSRVLYGARVSLSVGVLAMTVAITAGTAWGACAGFAGPRLDNLMMRVVDAFLSIPRILLAIAVLAAVERIVPVGLVLFIGLTGWFGVSRIVRAEVLAARDKEYAVSARALGAGRLRLFLHHLLPNVAAPILVAATLGVGNVIVLEAGLSYLGRGIQPPAASWGNIIFDGVDQLTTAWWVPVFPGLAIIATVMALNALGDGLRDALDPRQLRAP